MICLYLWLVIHNEYLCTRSPTGHQPNTLQYNKRIVEKSDVAETLVKSLTLLENDISVKIAVLNVLQHLSKDSCKTHGIHFLLVCVISPVNVPLVMYMGTWRMLPPASLIYTSHSCIWMLCSCFFFYQLYINASRCFIKAGWRNRSLVVEMWTRRCFW